MARRLRILMDWGGGYVVGVVLLGSASVLAGRFTWGILRFVIPGGVS